MCAAENAGVGKPKTTGGAKEFPTLELLLVEEPLHSRCEIQSLFDPNGSLACPDPIHVHCENPRCGGVRRHEYGAKDFISAGSVMFYLLRYKCTNCNSAQKVYGLRVERDQTSGFCSKIYQEPSFGDPIPKRLFEIIGEETREAFLQARRSIARGLGIGAYAYYRRIVENTKFNLIGAILRVAEQTNASKEQIETLQRAQRERQFTKAIELVQDVAAIPAVLLIDGHNPLALLHDLLSEGIHELDDAECLQRAKDAEVVLCDVAERMQTAVTERKNVKAALTSIMARKQNAGQK